MRRLIDRNKKENLDIYKITKPSGEGTYYQVEDATKSMGFIGRVIERSITLMKARSIAGINTAI